MPWQSGRTQSALGRRAAPRRFSARIKCHRYSSGLQSGSVGDRETRRRIWSRARESGKSSQRRRLDCVSWDSNSCLYTVYCHCNYASDHMKDDEHVNSEKVRTHKKNAHSGNSQSHQCATNYSCSDKSPTKQASQHPAPTLQARQL